MASESFSGRHRPVPFYRDVKVLAILAQVAFVIMIGLLFWYLIGNMLQGLRRSNIPLGFEFLRQTAGFGIQDPGVAYQPTDTYGRAFLVGIVNTLRVSALGVVMATLLGIAVGVTRLSSNWLLRTLSATYVEVFRNTPLLVQLFFWAGIMAQLPRVRDSVGIEGFLLMSNRGLALATPAAGASFSAWLPWLLVGLVVGVVVYGWRRRQLARLDRPGYALPQALLAALLVTLIGAGGVWLVTGSSPVVLDRPEFAGFNYTGGATLSAFFFVLLIGLTMYTSAFIAEIIRGGIQAVSKGQREAALALGLTPGQTLRLVIFPQAVRIIIPPLTNQYLNLVKNSSLGIAIGFADLFFVATTTANQSGAIVQAIVLLMASYLSVSLLTSLLMNWYNRRTRLVER